MCDVVILVMCVLCTESYSMCPLILSLYTDRKCLNYSFKIMLNITIKVNAYGCRPEKGRISMIIHWYNMVHFMMKIIVLIIYAYLNL